MSVSIEMIYNHFSNLIKHQQETGVSVYLESTSSSLAFATSTHPYTWWVEMVEIVLSYSSPAAHEWEGRKRLASKRSNWFTAASKFAYISNY